MKNKIFPIIFLFAFFIIFLFINPTYIAYTTYQHNQPDIELDLIKTIYSSNENLDGSIKLNFNGPIDANSKIKLSINGKETEKTILEILQDLYKTPSIEYGTLTITNDEQTKTLEYEQADIKNLATQISSPISELSFKIEGLPLDNSYPKFLKIDILDDNIPDYIYLGNPSSDYKSEIKADSLDIDASKADYILDPKHYYCELINLPYTLDLKINVDYTGTGDISAIILPVTISGSDIEAHYSSDTCTLSGSSCIISLEKAVQGDYLICVNASSSNIKIKKEEQNLQNSKGYKCDIKYLNEPDEKSLCTPQDLPDSDTRLGDFFITIQVPEYTGELKTSESFKADNLDIINEYLTTSCTPDSLCTIPISISSDSKGKLKISDIQIKYGSTIKNFLSDYIKTPDIIYEIDNQDLTNLELLIPASIFDITIPEITNDQQELTVIVLLGTKSDEQVIQVYKTKSADASSLADDLYTSFYSFTEEEKEIISYLGYDINSLLMQLENYQQEIQSILNSTLTESEKTLKLDIIKQSLEDIKETVPTSIQITKRFLNIPTQKPTEIPDIYLSEEQRDFISKQQLLELQNRINIKTDLIVFKLRTNDVEEENSLVKKMITGYIKDFYLIEEVPKTIASSIQDIRFGTDNYEIIQEDPIVRWSVTSLPITIYYILPGNILDSFNELTTTLIPKTISYEPSEKYQRVVCGDGICTMPLEDKITCPEDCMKKINWWFVIVLLAILIGGVYYLNFYKGKLSFQKITRKDRKPSLFKTKVDEINLRNYIKKSLAHQIPKSRIKRILLAKGWSEKQIDYIFKTI